MSQQTELAEVAEKARRFSPAMFAITAICFLLPFVMLTCAGQEVFSLSGLDLVTGTEISEEDLSEEMRGTLQEFEEGFGGETSTDTADEEGDRVDPQLWAIVALALAAIGAVGGFLLRGQRAQLLAAVAGIAGVVSLILLRATFSVEGESEGAQELGQVDVGYEWRIGWWIALLLFLVQPLLHFERLRRLRGRSGVEPRPGSPETPPPPPGGTAA